MPFEIIRDDITRVKADAIVNTANPEPIVGAGTDSAIHSAAGPKLLAARKKIGRIAVGTSVHTPAYDLHAKYVLHTVSPAWIDGTRGEEALLRQSYDAALKLATHLRCRSVAFPLLSAGSYGFPQDRALSVAVAAFTDYLLKHDLSVTLVVFGGDTAALAGGLFGDLKAYIDDRYVDEAKKAEYIGSFRRGQSLRNEVPAAPVPQAEGASFDAVCEETDEPAVFGKRGQGAALHAAQAAPAFRRKYTEMPMQVVEAKPSEAYGGAAKASDLRAILKGAECTFSEYLLDLLKECGEKDSNVYRRAEISRQLFHKIISKKDYQPTKSTAIQLASVSYTNLSETQKLLRKAGYALTRSSKTDLVVQYFIEHGIYSIVTVNMALYDCGLPLLKTGSAS